MVFNWLCVQSYKHDLHLALNRTRSYRNQYSQILYTGTKLQPASSRHYQVPTRENHTTTVCILLTKQPAPSRQELSYIQHLQREAKLQPASYRQSHASHSQHHPDRAMQVTASSFRQKPSHSLHPPDRAMQVAASIFQTEPFKSQPASFRQSMQVTASILKMKAKLQLAFSWPSEWKPRYGPWTRGWSLATTYIYILKTEAKSQHTFCKQEPMQLKPAF